MKASLTIFLLLSCTKFVLPLSPAPASDAALCCDEFVAVSSMPPIMGITNVVVTSTDIFALTQAGQVLRWSASETTPLSILGCGHVQALSRNAHVPNQLCVLRAGSVSCISVVANEVGFHLPITGIEKFQHDGQTGCVVTRDEVICWSQDNPLVRLRAPRGGMVHRAVWRRGVVCANMIGPERLVFATRCMAVESGATVFDNPFMCALSTEHGVVVECQTGHRRQVLPTRSVPQPDWPARRYDRMYVEFEPSGTGVYAHGRNIVFESESRECGSRGLSRPSGIVPACLEDATGYVEFGEVVQSIHLDSDRNPTVGCVILASRDLRCWGAPQRLLRSHSAPPLSWLPPIECEHYSCGLFFEPAEEEE